MNYPLQRDNLKIFEKKNPIVALNVLYVKRNEYIYLYFKTQLKSWKPNHSFNDSKWRKIALSCSKKNICIIKRINVKTWWCILLFELPLFLQNIKNKIELHKKVCENKDYCGIVMSSGDSKILEFNQN